MSSADEHAGAELIGRRSPQVDDERQRESEGGSDQPKPRIYSRIR
jgi:hypothetical protein